MNSVSIGCVVLAAGNAERFGANKLAAEVQGRSLLARALDAVPVDALAAVCVVTQYDEAARLAQRRGFEVVRNERAQDGLSRSVRLGTQALQGRCDAIVFLVADQPLLRRASVAALLDFYRDNSAQIVAASHGAQRGNPCVFPRKYFAELCRLTGDVGGSAVIRAHAAELRLFELPARELRDVDTRAALDALPPPED
ncbi:MAG: nucleotidyltransferase family protein [Oscillospiraceae bacterium]|nr:nucleotidyltransferase family protein [Oscillospiraceae bacterium]